MSMADAEGPLSALAGMMGVEQRLCALQVWDLRAKRSVHTLTEQYQVTAVAFAEAGDQVGCCICAFIPPGIRPLCCQRGQPRCAISPPVVSICRIASVPLWLCRMWQVNFAKREPMRTDAWSAGQKGPVG